MSKRSLKIVVISALMAVGLFLPISIAYAKAEVAPVTVAEEKAPAQTVSAAESETQTQQAKEPDAAANDKKEVAHVVWVKGTFFATVAGSEEKRPLKTSGKIYMNDTLVTSAGSEAQIVFSDNSLMTFRPETKFYINEYNYQPKAKKTAEEKSAGRYVMDLLEGGFRTITGLVAKDAPDNYQVNTPVATIGVRGTDYAVVLEKNGELFVKRYKGEPCLAKGSDSKEKSEAVCLDSKKRYASVDSDGNTRILTKEPDVFNVDVEVVPVSFSSNAQGFCGINGCGGDSGGGSGFCIQ